MAVRGDGSGGRHGRAGHRRIRRRRHEGRQSTVCPKWHARARSLQPKRSRSNVRLRAIPAAARHGWNPRMDITALAADGLAARVPLAHCTGGVPSRNRAWEPAVKLLLTVILACVALGGCGDPGWGWKRTDGQSTKDNPELHARFESDKRACIGQVQFNGLSGTPSETALPGSRGTPRQGEAMDVVRDCMARRGYRVVPIAETE